MDLKLHRGSWSTIIFDHTESLKKVGFGHKIASALIVQKTKYQTETEDESSELVSAGVDIREAYTDELKL